MELNLNVSITEERSGNKCIRIENFLTRKKSSLKNVTQLDEKNHFKKVGV